MILVSELGFKLIPQIAWYSQIAEQIKTSKRIIDTLPIKDISDMYDSKKFICDTCGKSLEKCDFSVSDHVTHLINPSIYWSCEDCINSDIRNGGIFAMSELSRSEIWKENQR